MKPAVFLDRDGTLIHESGYLDRLDRLQLFPFSVDAVRLLNRAGLAVVVMTNQSGIGRGLIREAFVAEAHAHIADGSRRAARGSTASSTVRIIRTPTCRSIASRCDCRKPAPGMMRSAAQRPRPRSRALVRRRRSMGRCRGGAGGRARRRCWCAPATGGSPKSAPRAGVRPDAVADNLVGAVAWILRQA